MEKKFAKIEDSSNEVLTINLSDSIDYLLENYGGKWVEIKEYHNQPYASYIWDSSVDNFYPPKPLTNPSFVLNTELAIWEPPIPKPDDGEERKWSEEHQKWIRACIHPIRTGTEPFELSIEQQNDEFQYEFNFEKNTWERIKYEYDLETDDWIKVL